MPIIDSDYSVNINGFNESLTYQTKIVEVDLHFPNYVKKIHAICVPEIKTKLILPGLSKIVECFVEKGYDLADKYLMSNKTDCINNLQLVLGTNDPDVILEKQVSFGNYSNKSAYSITNAGILLMGNAENLLQNLNSLPHFKIVDCNVTEVRTISPSCSTMHSDPPLDSNVVLLPRETGQSCVLMQGGVVGPNSAHSNDCNAARIENAPPSCSTAHSDPPLGSNAHAVGVLPKETGQSCVSLRDGMADSHPPPPITLPQQRAQQLVKLNKHNASSSDIDVNDNDIIFFTEKCISIRKKIAHNGRSI